MSLQNLSIDHPRRSISLCLEKAEKLYKSEKRVSTFSPKELVSLLGYTKKSGSSTTIIASLKKYGLLSGNGLNTSLTETGRVYFSLGQDDSRRYLLLRQFTFTPDIFKQIYKDLGEAAQTRKEVNAWVESRYNLEPKKVMEITNIYLSNIAYLGVNKSPTTAVAASDEIQVQPENEASDTDLNTFFPLSISAGDFVAKVFVKGTITKYRLENLIQIIRDEGMAKVQANSAKQPTQPQL